MSAAEKQLILKTIFFAFHSNLLKVKVMTMRNPNFIHGKRGLCKNKHTFIFQVGTLRSQLFIDDDSDDNVFK